MIEQKKTFAKYSGHRRSIPAMIKTPPGLTHIDWVNLPEEWDINPQLYERYDTPLYNEQQDGVAAMNLSSVRNLLRRAWKGDAEAIGEIKQLGSKVAHWSVSERGAIEVTCKTQLGSAVMLFLRDYAKGRLAVCANPDCVQPYFVRSRNTQRYCDHPECMAFSHRESMKNYWKTKGKKRRKR